MGRRRIAIAVAAFAGFTTAAITMPARAAFPGANGRLAVLVRLGDGNSTQLLTVAADGTRPRKLTSRATSVHWSADGRRMVVGLPCVRSGCGDNVGGPAGPAALEIIDAGSGLSRRIRTSDSLGYEGPIAPSWTPAGRLLWSRHEAVEAGSSEVVLADHRGHGPRVVPVDEPVFGALARAAPTGGLIAVAVSSPIGRLVVVPAGGGPQRELIGCPLPSPENPFPQCLPIGALDWSPDGTHIAFEAVRDGSSVPMIRTIDVATGEMRDVRPGWSPFWSPDGRRLGSISPAHRIEIGPASPGNTNLLGPSGAVAADWQARRGRESSGR
jgi:hypothetical protein